MSPSKTKKTSASALTKVHDLYVMQLELWKVIDNELRNEEQLKAARKTLKEFNALLSEVDWRYMGGEDVLEEMESMCNEASKKIKEKRKAIAARAEKKTAVKKVTKKAKPKKK